MITSLVVDPGHNKVATCLTEGSAVARLVESIVPQRPVTDIAAKSSSWLDSIVKGQALHDNSLKSAISDISERKGMDHAPLTGNG